MLRSVGVAAVVILQDVVEMVFCSSHCFSVLLLFIHCLVNANLPAVETLLFSVPWFHYC